MITATPRLRRLHLGQRALLRLVGVVAALALLGACSGGPSIDAGQPPEAPDDFEESASASSAATPSTPASPATSPAGGPWIVSLGDSFISGEAGRWAGNSYGSAKLIDALGRTAYFDSPNGTSELIPLCHRSKSAMVHIGDGGSPSDPGTPVGSTNLACSGAKTKTFTEDSAFKPGLDFVGAGTAQQGQAAMLADLARSRNVQMVLVSIGGNDFGFADVIQDCFEVYVKDEDYCSDDTTVTDRVNPGNIKMITADITTALQNVQKAMRNAGYADGSWTLVVNLNPDTLPLAGQFRYGETYSRWYDGGCGFYDKDAQWAGATFVNAVRNAAAAAMDASGISPAVLLDLSDLLDARELCAKGTEQVGDKGGAKNWQAAGAVDVSEWANEVRTEDSGPYFEQESLHPNYWGQLAARSCVRQLYAATGRVDSVCRRTGSGLSSRGEPVVTLQARLAGR